MTVLEEMTQLIMATPGSSSAPTDIATWYERKAHLLERIAEEGSPDARELRDVADSARHRASRLRAA